MDVIWLDFTMQLQYFVQRAIVVWVVSNVVLLIKLMPKSLGLCLQV